MKTRGSSHLPAPASHSPCPSAPSRTTRPRGAVDVNPRAPDAGGGGAIEALPGYQLDRPQLHVYGQPGQRRRWPDQRMAGPCCNSPSVTVTISGSQFISNSAIGSGVGAIGEGGAVDNFHTMTVANSLFTGNAAIGSGVGAPANGGAVYNSQTMTIANSSLTATPRGRTHGRWRAYLGSGRGGARILDGRCGFEWRSDPPDPIQYHRRGK